jgi:hypothetical protein
MGLAAAALKHLPDSELKDTLMNAQQTLEYPFNAILRQSGKEQLEGDWPTIVTPFSRV